MYDAMDRSAVKALKRKGQKNSEIAATMGMNPKTVKSILGARPETLDAHLLGALWGTTESTEDGESRDFGPKILLLSA